MIQRGRVLGDPSIDVLANSIGHADVLIRRSDCIDVELICESFVDEIELSSSIEECGCQDPVDVDLEDDENDGEVRHVERCVRCSAFQCDVGGWTTGRDGGRSRSELVYRRENGKRFLVGSDCPKLEYVFPL